jgi:hypothetical protein
MVRRVPSKNDAARRGTDMPAYPINSAELSRRLLGRELIPDDDRPFVDEVRAELQRFGCPRESGSYRPAYRVDEAMARRVAAALGRKLR